MSKLSSASIRLVQKMNRPMKDGTYPIYICVCFHGRMEKKTGVSCLPKHWNAKQECIKSGCPNFPVLNKMLSDIKNRVIERKNKFEFQCKVYTPALLLQDTEIDFNGATNVFKTMMESLIEERRLKAGTIRSYDYTWKKLSEFIGRKDFITDELTLGVVKDFASWLERNNIKVNTIKRILSCVAAVWNYGIAKKIISGDDYPFREFQYTQKYHEVSRDYFLEKSHMVRLKEYFLDMVVIRNGNRWSYKDGAYDKLHKRTTKEFALLWFLMMYRMSGSAPIDFALLEPKHCKRITINGVEYWAIDTKRKKTSREVHIRLKRDMLTIIGLEHFLGSSGHFVYPVINWYEGETEKRMQEQCHKTSDKAIKKLREVFVEINGEIAKENALEHRNEPLIDPESVVMYSARHSRASNYFNTPGATIGGLATMLARSANTIATYAHHLKKDEDLAELDETSAI